MIDYDERVAECGEAVKRKDHELSCWLVETAYIAGGLDAEGMEVRYGD